MEKRLTMILAGLFLCLGMAFAQTQVSGTVTSSEDGQPVVGVSVRVVGTSTGTVTDVDGNFSLVAPANAKLNFSYIGMLSKTLKASSNMKIKLEPDNKTIDEVIVTGYGNFKKSSFTGSASSMDATKLEDVPVVSVEDKLAGSVSGVTVTSSSSAPGAISNIRIRGMGSVNAGNNPLYVIDGTPVASSNLSEFNTSDGNGYNDAGTSVLATLNPNDIESITVIKDAAAASLYGSRAANGVIVITTKSGKKGKTKIDFRSDLGFSNTAINYRPQLSGDDRRQLLWTGLKNYSITDGSTAAAAATFADNSIDKYASVPTNGYTDWKDLLFKTGNHQNYQVSLSGGDESTKFYASMAYMKQDGILKNQGLERFTGNASITHDWNRLSLRVTTLISKMNQSLVDEGTSYVGALANYCFFQSPSSTPYNTDGSLNTGCGIFGVNPLYELQHSSDKNIVKRSFTTAQLTYNIWDNLKLSEKLAYDYTDGRENVLWDRYSNNGAPGAVLQRVINEYEKLNTQTQLSYIKSFGQHNVDALLGFETEDYTYRYDYSHGSDYPGDLYELENASTTSAQSDKKGYRMTSFLGRLNYNFANKYYLGASYRRDGSSRLARQNRWGDFWSLSGSWRFTEEKFMNPVKGILTDGKVRLSYGVNGTQPYDYYSYMNLYRYGIYYNGASGIGVTTIGNSDLKWEKNKTLNIGLDLTLLDRFTITFDYYNRKTSDLIFDKPVSAVTGLYSNSGTPSAPINVGSLVNKGFELSLTSVNINKKDFNWTTTLNMSHNSNKVEKLTGDENEIISGVLIHRVGKPYYSYYMYEYAGVDKATGKESYYINDGTDNARNTTTDVSKAKQVIVGQHQASIEGGLTNNVKWKFIDLGFTFTYSLGGDAYDAATWQHSNGGSSLYSGAVPSYYKLSDMWSPDNTDATLPKFEYGGVRVNSSRWLMPTDYLRLKNLSLGFTVPKNYIANLGIDRVRVYFSAANLLTWKSKKLPVDPEMPVDGLCTFETPALRTYTFGIELGF